MFVECTADLAVPERLQVHDGALQEDDAVHVALEKRLQLQVRLVPAERVEIGEFPLAHRPVLSSLF